MSTVDVGPDQGTLEVRTYRDGIARKLGHDLIIDVRTWQACVGLAASGELDSVTLDVDSRSLRVREGNGLKPLTDDDRADIVKNIDANVLRGEPITFRSTSVEHENGRARVSGDLTVAGTTRPATFDLDVAEGGRVKGVLSVVQSEHGITPFSAPGGLLRLRDAVDVAIDVTVGTGGDAA